jgi:CHAT domain
MAFRISFKIGGRVRINDSEVLPVTLAIYEQQEQIEELVSFLFPLPEPLAERFKQWQDYIAPKDRKDSRRVRKEDLYRISGGVNLTGLANSLKAELNRWLGQDGWVDEDGQPDPRVGKALEDFRKNITSKDEVQIIVQTEDRQLRGLPWQEWDTLAGYTTQGIEVAVSATNFKRLTQKQTPQLRATVRILVVFGDEGLGFEEEEAFLNNLKRYGGEPHILRQPTRQQLEESLKDRQGWHIFFFAGHSESDHHGRIGRIQISPANGAQGIVEITELRDLLVGVIQKKLQLAIFNSCDGLGLANQLTALSLPYCIVMREEVESSVARELLRHFLTSFAKKDRSLFASMSAARQQLQQQFVPGKSWLPVIVANPLARELTWNRLFSERRLPWQGEVALGIVVIAILVSLPISILSEFQSWETLMLYAKLYPHLVVYPSLLLWMPLFATYKAHCMIRVKTRPFLVLTLITILLTLAALFFEITSDRMMLMEFKSSATTTIDAQQLPQLYSKWQTSESDISRIPEEIFNAREAFDAAGNLTLKKSDLEAVVKHIYTAKEASDVKGSQGFSRIATAYDVWKRNTGAFSVSRWFYVLSFLAIIGCGVQIMAMVATILSVPDSIFNKSRYLTYLILCELGVLLWVPFQGYSIGQIKSKLFSPEFQATVAGMNILVYVIIILLFIATWWSIRKSASKKYQQPLLLLLCGSLGLTLLGSWFGSSLIDLLFGMNSISFPTPWIVSSVFLICVFLVVVRLIDLHVVDE